MSVIFRWPLVLSVVGTLFFLGADLDLKWKGLAVIVTGASVAFQFVPELAAEVHFLVPAFMQLAVCLWVVLYWQME